MLIGYCCYAVAGSFDFFGVNHYTSLLVGPGTAGENPSLLRDIGIILSMNASWPSSASAWLKVGHRYEHIN
jgi:hypothetical protein